MALPIMYRTRAAAKMPNRRSCLHLFRNACTAPKHWPEKGAVSANVKINLSFIRLDNRHITDIEKHSFYVGLLIILMDFLFSFWYYPCKEISLAFINFAQLKPP